MQVDVLHRNHLGVPTAGGPALHPETGAEGRLTQAHHGFFTEFVEAVGKPHGSGGFALPRRRRGNGGYQYQFAVRPLTERFKEFQADLGLGMAKRHQRLSGDVQFGGDFRDGLDGRVLCDLDV